MEKSSSLVVPARIAQCKAGSRLPTFRPLRPPCKTNARIRNGIGGTGIAH